MDDVISTWSLLSVGVADGTGHRRVCGYLSQGPLNPAGAVEVHPVAASLVQLDIFRHMVCERSFEWVLVAGFLHL
jgi:hypothetical protein